jgi:phage-related protein
VKRVVWIGSSRTDPAAKPLKGFGGSSVMEISRRYDRNTYRVVYTTKFAETVYVLHAFQKKSTQGVKTTKQDMSLIKRRLELARKLAKINAGLN